MKKERKPSETCRQVLLWVFAHLPCSLHRALGCVTLIIEWPRGKRAKGYTIPRDGQFLVQPFVAALGPFSRNLFIRAVAWLMFSVACYFAIPTIIGGVTLTVSA